MPDVGRFEAVLLCEDIRREDTGKMFVSGIYTGDILPFDLPTSLTFRLFLHYFAPISGTRPLNFLWSLDEEEVARVEGTVNHIDLQVPIGLYLPPVTIECTKPVILRVEAESNGDRQPVISRRVLEPQPGSNRTG